MEAVTASLCWASAALSNRQRVSALITVLSGYNIPAVVVTESGSYFAWALKGLEAGIRKTKVSLKVS